MDAVHRASADYPSGKAGDVLTVMFTVMGIPCLGLNGGPAVQHNIAFSFQIVTADQMGTNRYWNAIVGRDCHALRRRFFFRKSASKCPDPIVEWSGAAIVFNLRA